MNRVIANNNSRRPIWAAVASVLLAITAAQVRAENLDVLPPASQRFAAADAGETPDFQKHIVPLLGRLGCNGRSCHGSFQGRGGLRMSLFGFDFQMDHQALAENASSDGRRIDRGRPEDSLILRKPMMQVEHEGGQRFSVGSWQHHLLQHWIEGGAAGIDQPEKLQRLEVEPAEAIFGRERQLVRLRVTAVWSDGDREDVTPLCRFRSNNDSVASIDPEGRIAAEGFGDTHIIVFYDNGIVSVPVLRPLSTATPSSTRTINKSESDHPIDRLVMTKLDKLGILPSDRCTDAEFLRRVSIDLTGTLPAAEEVVEFLEDPTSDKREKKVEALLERPAYAAWWANKLCDFTGCNPSQQAELGQETSTQWYRWIYSRLRENTPYDQLVKGIVLAKSRDENQSYDDYVETVSSYFRADGLDEFAQRETMPHYWTRRSMRKPEDAAKAFAHNFLGIRLQCAECHKHPFASWTQDDFKEFSRFFTRVKFGMTPQSADRYRELAKQVGLRVRDESGASVNMDVLKQAQRGSKVPWRELYIEKRDRQQSLDLLQSRTVALEGDSDPRAAIMSWMREPNNPWFAKAMVNRVWASYFHVGIIDPPDDLNPANPASNPALLDCLTRGFVENGFDMKWLHRQIVASQTYQRSWKPNATNREDRYNFSRAVPRRMPAEVVYDSVKQALAATDKTQEVRTDLTRRAIGDLSMRLAGTYAMQVFGKPDRAVNCDCERVNQPTLLQSIFLQNDPLMDQRIHDSQWLEEIAQQLSGGAELDHEQLVRTAWLRTLSRPPRATESSRAVEHLVAAESTVDGLRDLLWALINTKEFILLH